MARYDDLHVLAGTAGPISDNGGELARLFDLLVAHYSFVIVDASTRLDSCARVVADVSDLVMLIAQTDVASLWSAARVRQYLGESGDSERVRLVLNRFKRIAGFSESDAEAATGTKLLWKIPNCYAAISSAIDRGVPVIQQNHAEVARSFNGLAEALAEKDTRRRNWSLFKTA
jgi:Flp pilus assembly CpaE family ATPase